MNKINVCEYLNLSSMTVPKGSIPASIASRHTETAAMRMHRCTYRRSACMRRPAPKSRPSAGRSHGKTNKQIRYM